MNINTAFPSKYLRAADLNGATTVVTIDRVELEEIGQGSEKQRKPVLYFTGKSKAMVLNKTNATMIARIAKSEDTEDWVGIQIRLISAEVEFQGNLTEALRVREVKNGAKQVAPTPPPVDRTPVETPSDDDIPF